MELAGVLHVPWHEVGTGNRPLAVCDPSHRANSDIQVGKKKKKKKKKKKTKKRRQKKTRTRRRWRRVPLVPIECTGLSPLPRKRNPIPWKAL